MAIEGISKFLIKCLPLQVYGRVTGLMTEEELLEFLTMRVKELRKWNPTYVMDERLLFKTDDGIKIHVTITRDGCYISDITFPGPGHRNEVVYEIPDE